MSAGVWGQKVYKCGNSYSQIPCAGGVTVDADDARSTAQKAAADQQTLRDARAADTLEKTRLKQEALALAQSKAAAKAKEKSREKSASAKSKAESDEDAKKKARAKKKEPEFFTARTAAEKKADDNKP